MRIAVLGAGLLGGSIVCDLQGRTPFRLWARRRETLEEAVRFGICRMEETAPTIAEAVEEADLAIICTPPGAVAAVAAEAEKHLPPAATLTDVASIKQRVIEEVHRTMTDAGRFVGSHPMAGSHEAGIAAARRGLFAGAHCILTPSPLNSGADLARVRHFWESLGLRVVEMSPEEHDRAVAAMSHLPHATASALTNFVCTMPGEPARFCGNGFRDTTRVAAGPVEMWSEIIMWNKDNIIRGLDGLSSELNRLRDILLAGDRAALARYLGLARERRRALDKEKNDTDDV